VNPDQAPNLAAERKILSVAQLNQRARQLLETHFSRIWVEGEISNLVRPSSGHWYFTLKDAKAQVRCAMFRNRNQLLKFRAEDGMKITARGRLSIYENRGDYQLIVESLEESGVGALQRAFEQLKQELSSRGWFDAEHKRPLPALPQHIGVVTSPSGAAIRDIVAVLRRRFPSIPLTLLPTPVQGDTAAAQIADAINSANRLGATLEPPLDVLIVGRGGGSLEDLWAFNEEIVARAIHQSVLPLVSAVGHEIDFSIADLVADHRAATPSAAAELLSPDQDQLLATINAQHRRLAAAIGNRLASQQQQLTAMHKRLKHPGTRLQEYSLRLDELELRLLRASQRAMRQGQVRVEQVRQRLALLTPQSRIDRRQERLQHLLAQLHQRWQTQLQTRQLQLARNAELLHSVSPLQTLLRGYAIVADDSGGIVRSVTQLTTDDTVNIRISDGDVDARIL
jgi:exodeoxyribonuclease VII large subunit